jgi:TatD DNase family protein
MIFDTHAHYDDRSFDEDRDELLASLKDNGVGTVINVGASWRGCEAAVDLSHKWDFIYAAVGLHPDEVGCLDDQKMAQLRKWALEEGKLCIITGPLFFGTRKVMGDREIPVPDAFYKIILDMSEPYRMTAFIIPNNATKRRLNTFVTAVDKIEEATGFDFFPDFPNAEEMEKTPNIWE